MILDGSLSMTHNVRIKVILNLTKNKLKADLSKLNLHLNHSGRRG